MHGTRSSPGLAGPRWEVLVVDDEPVVRAGVSKILEAEGLSVAVAQDAASALDHPALADCRLVLCDLVLPDMSGIDLVKRLQRYRPGMPVILITGYATGEQEALAVKAGAAFLAKPFDESELLATVRAALKRSKRATEEERP